MGWKKDVEIFVFSWNICPEEQIFYRVANTSCATYNSRSQFLFVLYVLLHSTVICWTLRFRFDVKGFPHLKSSHVIFTHSIISLSVAFLLQCYSSIALIDRHPEYEHYTIGYKVKCKMESYRLDLDSKAADCSVWAWHHTQYVFAVSESAVKK